MRVHDDRVRTLPAGEGRTVARDQRDGAGIGGIHVQPQGLALGDCRERGDRIHGCGGGRAERRDHGDRGVAGGPVGRDRAGQRVRLHRVVLVGRDAHHAGPTETQGHGGFLDGRVGLRGGVDPQSRQLPAGESFGRDVEPGDLSRGRQGDQG